MAKHSYIGQVRDGKLTLDEPNRLQMLEDFGKVKEGKLVEIEWRVLPYRSNQQSRYYWGLVVKMVMEALQDLGHEVDATLTHEMLKLKFNPKKVGDSEGEIIGEYGGSTKEMSNTEFIEYLEKIKRFAAEHLDIVIPDPEIQTIIPFKEPNNEQQRPIS